MALFSSEIERIRPNLAVPYPERKQFLRELLADMESFYEERVSQGAEPEAAKQEAQRRFRLSQDDYCELEAIHRSRTDRLLCYLPASLRKPFVVLVRLSLGVGFLIILFMEAPVREFFYQGGPVVYLIIAIGLGGLVVQFTNFFRWFLKKDHSDQSLEKNSSAPLLMALVTFLLGVLGSAMGYYTVLTKWATNTINFDQMRVGLYEPLPCLVVATALAISIATLHVFTQWHLRARGVPKIFLQNA